MKRSVMNSTTKVLWLSVLSCGFVGLATGQTIAKDISKSGTTAASFLEISVGAPAVGMGGAFVSIAQGASALYWNAAGIASLESSELMLTHTQWIADTKFDFAGFVLPLGNLGTVGLSFTSLSMEDMKVRTVEMPEGTGEFFSAGDLAVGFSYARSLTDRFKIGITAKYIQQRIWHVSATAFAVDVGTTFRTDLFGSMVIGATVTNFGTSMRLDGRDTRQFIRIDRNKQGSNDRIPTTIELDAWDLPLNFQIGASTNVVDNERYRWTIAVDALHPTDNYESVNVGSEVVFHNYLFLRGGYQSLFLSQAEGGISFGLGVASNGLLSGLSAKIDYAYRDFGRLESIHVLSVGLQF